MTCRQVTAMNYLTDESAIVSNIPRPGRNSTAAGVPSPAADSRFEFKGGW